MNAKKHGCLGALGGAGYTLIKYLLKKSNDPETNFPWEELALNVVIGFTLASLPDWLEPATNPNHRSFFHSLVMAWLICYGMYGKPTREVNEKLLILLRAIGVSYLCHLAADAKTTKSLPLIHPVIL